MISIEYMDKITKVTPHATGFGIDAEVTATLITLKVESNRMTSVHQIHIVAS